MATCSNSDQDMGTNGAGLWNTNESFHGIELNGDTSCLYGETVTSMTTKLWRITSASTDLFYYKIFNSAGVEQATTTGVAQNTLTDSAGGALLQLEFTTSHVMADGDRIGIWYDGANGIRAIKSDSVKSANGYLGVLYQGGWTTSNILQGYVTATTESPIVPGGTRFPPSPIVLGGL